IYTVQKFHVPTKKALGFAKKLSHISGKKLNWYPEALRISVQALLAANQPVSIEQLSMTYPRYYKTFVSEYALKHKIPEYYLYALIRSESFFDAGITSHANAIGLTQLIDTTAADMARKLKLKDYDITNPHDNIQIGSYYLQELYGRLDNSYIQAFFSYNGGITRVRRWKKQWENLPNDLFLEVLPYAETREYGRKIASAAAMYGVLYYDKSTSEILNEFFK
ncbi:MAG TPA: lytic transglycosylase domain-containing protein, partial [Treponemataceae bacterium]|nr:lytic transglycosylase domain-containing protein [Treponemataceae bacterium]